MNHKQEVPVLNGTKGVDALIAAISTVLLDKEREVKLALCCLLAQGHLLLEDLPGMGKTTLAHTLAQVLGLAYSRVQFTSDLLPADLLGLSVFNRERASFDFHPGPVFTQLLLADELNRATPKTQSALLEAMEERQVSVEGSTRPLPSPFFVIATQNPQDQSGTFELPESQLDRFAMRLSLGYPSPQAEMLLLQGVDSRKKLTQLTPLMGVVDLERIQREVSAVAASSELLGYIQRLIVASRQHAGISQGISPRAGIVLVNVAKAWAFSEKRHFVVPEDVQAVFSAVIAHRLKVNSGSEQAMAQQLLQDVNVV